jgi:hypothetical protein
MSLSSGYYPYFLIIPSESNVEPEMPVGDAGAMRTSENLPSTHFGE